MAIKTILGLVALLGLAYVGAHPRVQRWERALGISQVITAGFPFVALGLLARHPQVGILNDAILAQLAPVFRLGLGWVGFIIGFRLDAGIVEALPRRAASLVTTGTAVTFLVIVGASALLLSTGVARSSLTDPVFLRDALILGTAGALTSLTAPQLLAARGGGLASVALVGRVVRLQELAGIAGLLVIAAYFRPRGDEFAWRLPGTAWLLLTLGLGLVVGVVLYGVLLRKTSRSAEAMVLILGSISFAAGIAGYLRLSPVVVCFVAGFILANFPGHYQERLGRTLTRLERPIYLIFLLLVGAIWQVRDARGWLLMAAFVVARFAGKWLGVRLSRGDEGDLAPDARRALVVAPMGVLSIAIVVSAQMLYPGGSVSLIVTAIVGGAMVTEVLVQLLTRGRVPGAGRAEAGGAAGPRRPSRDSEAG